MNDSGRHTDGGLRRVLPALAALAAAGGWAWAALILLDRYHDILRYTVQPDYGRPLGGIVFVAVVALGLAAMLGKWGRGAARYLALAWAIPLAALARQLWPGIPATFLEPIFLAWVTGLSASAVARALAGRQSLLAWAAKIPWGWITALAALAAGVWMYLHAVAKYDDYLLGYYDFGHYGRRVINTWAGRGWLLESPALPRFWDHFNPGLVLLAPLWGLWPDARFFMAIQAACLAGSAILVHGIARRLGAGGGAAMAWALAYLLFPPVSQLNLNYGYGWHPASVALPFILAGVWLWLARRPFLAAAAGLVACSMEENLWIVTAGLAVGLAVLTRKNAAHPAAGVDRQDNTHVAHPPSGVGCGANAQPRVRLRRMPQGSSLALLAFAGVCLAGFAMALVCGDFGPVQAGRFSHLGATAGEVLLSPILRPAAFWGQVLSAPSAYYILALGVPLGVRALARGWPVLLGLAVPLGVLLAWNADGSRSVAFQYVTPLIAILFLAALVGARRRSPAGAGLWVAGVAALAACLALSPMLGDWPWSQTTNAVMDEHDVQAGWPEHRRQLDDLTRRLDHPDVTIAASGRAAAHLLHAARLERVGDVMQGNWGFTAPAGQAGNSVEAFDYILVDFTDRFQQDRAAINQAIAAAQRAGYRLTYSADGIVLYERPGAK
jgi:uncharacterized membrane protein